MTFNYKQLGINDTNNRYSFTKIKLPFKTIKIFTNNLTSLIVNENNELYVIGYNKDGELGSDLLENIKIFIKINNNFNTKNYTFNFSHSMSSFIIDGSNNIFVSGSLEENVKIKEIKILLNKKKFS